MTDATVVEQFIERWEKSAGAERANYPLFLANCVRSLGCHGRGRRTGKRVAQVTELLEMLVALGQAAVAEGGRYVGV